MTIKPEQFGITAVKTTAQNVTANWADVGDVIYTKDAKSIQLWVDIDINDAQNFRFRVVGLSSASSAVEYEPSVTGAFSSGVSNVDKGYYEITTDADQKTTFRIELFTMYPYIKIQIQAGVAGATPGQLESLYVSVEK